MNCPVCGKEMERGILYTDSSRGLYFLPPGGKVGLWASERSVEKQGGIVLDGPYNSNLPNRSEMRGYICRACHKIVLEY